MQTFKDIIAWQKGYGLTLRLYDLTASFPRSEDFGLKSQIRRAAVSIISNIAEGFKRVGVKDSLYLYRVAEASLEEIKCQTMLAKDLGYLKEVDYSQLRDMQDEVGKLLNGWIKSQSRWHPS